MSQRSLARCIEISALGTTVLLYRLAPAFNVAYAAVIKRGEKLKRILKKRVSELEKYLKIRSMLRE